MKITKQETAIIDVENLKSLIKQALAKEGYKTNSISFEIKTPNKNKQTNNVKMYSSSIADDFQGVICSVVDTKSIRNVKSHIKVNESIIAKIADSEIFVLAKNHLISEGYKIIGTLELDFIYEDSSDGPHHSSYQVFNGIKCLVSKDTKNIEIMGE